MVGYRIHFRRRSRHSDRIAQFLARSRDRDLDHLLQTLDNNVHGRYVDSEQPGSHLRHCLPALFSVALGRNGGAGADDLGIALASPLQAPQQHGDFGALSAPVEVQLIHGQVTQVVSGRV